MASIPDERTKGAAPSRPATLKDVAERAGVSITTVARVLHDNGYVSGSTRDLVEAALAGGHICTMPFTIFQQMVKHPLTDIGLKKFLADWDAQNKK